MTNRKSQETDVFLHVIVILSILIEILIDALKCLTSLNSASSIPTPGKQDLQSKDIKSTKSGSTKTQQLSPSTKRRSTTAVQRKVDGGTMQDSQSLPTASSPRSKQSKPLSSTLTSTRSQSSQALATPRRTRTTKSTSPTTSQSPILKPNHTTADQINDSDTYPNSWLEHQPTEPLLVLPESQQEVQEHTVLRAKVSRSKLKG